MTPHIVLSRPSLFSNKNPVAIGEQADDVLNEMRRICEPETERRENLTVVLAHGRENPGCGQDAIEKEDCENRVTKPSRHKIATGGSHCGWLLECQKASSGSPGADTTQKSAADDENKDCQQHG